MFTLNHAKGEAITADYTSISVPQWKKKTVFSRKWAQISESMRQKVSDLKECTRSVLPQLLPAFSF